LDNKTKSVEILLGDPKSAIIKLSIPMMIAMLVQTLYNIVDGIWVAGLGKDELAAIGLFFPIFMIMLALAAGIGVGGSSTISRKIGEQNKELANSSASYTLIIGLFIGIVMTTAFYPFAKQIFLLLGATGNVVKIAASYSRILFGGSIILVFSNVSNGILRGEGDTKRVMYAMVIGTLLNIVLDPIFIYTFKLGVLGAAWATLISITVTALMIFYWLFIKKDSYVTIKLFGFKKVPTLIKEILRVGIPSSFIQFSMALTMFILNWIIIKVAGTDGVAIFTSAWRITMFGIVPLLGIAMGMTAVTGAAFGAKEIKKLDTAYIYGIKMGIVIELFVVTIILIFAPQLAYLFTYSKGASNLAPELITALKWMALFLFTTPLGMSTSAMFQGIGKGERALLVTLFRTIIFQLIFAYLFGITLKLGLKGIWGGIGLGNTLAAVLAFIWGKFTIKKLEKQFNN